MAYIFTLRLAPFASKSVNVSRRSESLKIRKKSKSATFLLYTNCGLAKIRSVHTKDIPWMLYFGGKCIPKCQGIIPVHNGLEGWKRAFCIFQKPYVVVWW